MRILLVEIFQTPSSRGVPNLYTIQEVTGAHQGMYTCVARNVVGRSHAAAYLQVNTAPGRLMISK